MLVFHVKGAGDPQVLPRLVSSSSSGIGGVADGRDGVGPAAGPDQEGEEVAKRVRLLADPATPRL